MQSALFVRMMGKTVASPLVPNSHSSGLWGLSQGPFHGQLGQVAIGISQPLGLGLSCPSFPGWIMEGGEELG